MHGRDAAPVVRGTLIHSPARGDIEIIDDAVIAADSDGNIASIDNASTDSGKATMAAAGGNLTTLADGQFLLPGLVDLHIHAPQWPQLGKALHLPLDEWLQHYTFPLEARYDDLDFARVAYESLIDNLLAHGTTTATYFGTVHLASTALLAELAVSKGQRAVVGKVAMDNPEQCPDYYRDASAGAALDDTRALIRAWSCRRSRRDLSRAAPTTCCRASGRSPTSTAAMCRRIVPRATGNTGTSSTVTASTTRPASTASDC